MGEPFADYVDVLEASERLSIHPDSVRRLIRRGSFPAIEFFSKSLIRKTDLEQFAQTYNAPGRRKAL